MKGSGYRLPGAELPPTGRWAAAKLTSEQRVEIGRRYAAGETGSSLALEFGVSTRTITSYTQRRDH